MFNPYPYPDLEDEREELPAQNQSTDRVQINVAVNEDTIARSPRRPRGRKQKPFLTPANVVLLSGGSALVLSCLAWHFSGTRYQRQMTEQDLQHEAEIEQIERERETDKAKLRAVEGVVCNPAP